MWVDNTIAYNIPYSANIDSGRYLCGQILLATVHKVTISINCRETDMRGAQALCGIAIENPGSRTMKIEVEFPANRNYAFSHIECENHVSLPFIPCDTDPFEEACELAAGSQCSLGRRNPFFLCRYAGRRVSYTFLCDHRQDCWDNSDEDFCSYRDCKGNSLSLSCGSTTQVCLSSHRCDAIQVLCKN